jgi:Ser/Thr protein kinase RdoA (MazF antagonist)
VDSEVLSEAQRPIVLRGLAAKALENYELPHACSVELINLSENATYKIEAPDGRCWAMRVHRDGYQSNTAIASELAWLTELRASGIVTTPQPVAGRDGELIQLRHHPALPKPRRIVLWEWENGEEPCIDRDLRQPFETLGELAARMHLHTRTWKIPPWFERHTWDFETALGEFNPHWGHWRKGIGVETDIEKLFGRTVDLIGKRLAAYAKGPDRFGLIHADLRLANLLVDGATVKVIDFDDCGFGWHMYDAATPVSFHEHEPQVPELIESWKTGYRRVRALSKQDEAEIPTFIIFRRLLLVAWIGSHQDSPLARSLGQAYTAGTVGLCEQFLRTNS